LDAQRVLVVGWGGHDVQQIHAALRSRQPRATLASVSLQEFHTRDAKLPPERFDCIIASGNVVTTALPLLFKAVSKQLSDEGVGIILVPNSASWERLAALLGPGDGQATGATSDLVIQGASTAGVRLLRVSPIGAQTSQAQSATKALEPFLRHLGLDVQVAQRRIAPTAFLAQTRPRALKRDVLTISAGLLRTRVDAMGLVRVSQPLQAIASLPGFHVREIGHTISVAKDTIKKFDFFVWQRPIMVADDSLAQYEKILRYNRILIVEFDDHHERFPLIAQHNFLTFRAPHAVRTSTPALAQLYATYNPNVFIAPNSVDVLPPLRRGSRGPVRLLFAALNRQEDWAPHINEINKVLNELGSGVEVNVVFDRAFYDAIQVPNKHLYPLLTYDEYLTALSKSDVAWLPLKDTLFNRSKSDLKFIECAAHSVAVLCSPVVYGDSVIDNVTGIMADTPKAVGEGLRRLLGSRELRERLTEAAHSYVAAQRMRSVHVAAEARWLEMLHASFERLEWERIERMKRWAPEAWVRARMPPEAARV
jgi:hypothetical protein